MLVVAWGRQLQLLQLCEDGAEDGVTTRIKQLGVYEGDSEIISIAWLRGGPLLVLDSTYNLHAFDAELQEFAH